MNEGLEALKDIENELQFHYQDIDEYNITKFPREINIIEKELKALETIKHFIKSLGLTFIFSNDKTIVIVGGDEFEYWYKCKTQEEYDLLKEVLL